MRCVRRGGHGLVLPVFLCMFSFVGFFLLSFLLFFFFLIPMLWPAAGIIFRSFSLGTARFPPLRAAIREWLHGGLGVCLCSFGGNMLVGFALFYQQASVSNHGLARRFSLIL